MLTGASKCICTEKSTNPRLLTVIAETMRLNDVSGICSVVSISIVVVIVTSFLLLLSVDGC
jgi:hypothetical protein